MLNCYAHGYELNLWISCKDFSRVGLIFILRHGKFIASAALQP